MFNCNPMVLEENLKHHMELKKKALSEQVGGNHYKNMAIQPIEFCQVNNLGWCESNAIKYLCRWRYKNGVEDLKKARHYIDVLLQLVEEGKVKC